MLIVQNYAWGKLLIFSWILQEVCLSLVLYSCSQIFFRSRFVRCNQCSMSSKRLRNSATDKCSANGYPKDASWSIRFCISAWWFTMSPCSASFNPQIRKSQCNNRSTCRRQSIASHQETDNGKEVVMNTTELSRKIYPVKRVNNSMH